MPWTDSEWYSASNGLVIDVRSLQIEERHAAPSLICFAQQDRAWVRLSDNGEETAEGKPIIIKRSKTGFIDFFKVLNNSRPKKYQRRQKWHAIILLQSSVWQSHFSHWMKMADLNSSTNSLNMLITSKQQSNSKLDFWKFTKYGILGMIFISTIVSLYIGIITLKEIATCTTALTNTLYPGKLQLLIKESSGMYVEWTYQSKENVNSTLSQTL